MPKQERTHIIERLQEHRRTSAPHSMRKAFLEDPDRVSRNSARLESLFCDWSKCAVNDETFAILFDLAQATGLTRRHEALFSGAVVNSTERRPALHVALRNRSNRPILVDGKDVMPEVNLVLSRMREFSNAVRSGSVRGGTGEKFTDVVNIGIGGSHLGPAMATRALKPYHDGPRLHFVSNIDSADITDTIASLEPARTLFIVVSKTFTTVETLTNADSARHWIVSALSESAVAKHFAAVSTALGKVSSFGIPAERIFGFWDWIGGRYSLWSAVGLSLMIAIGADNFELLLAGGHLVDEHFRTTPLPENIPAILGLLGFWHRSICNYASRAVIPYDQRLQLLPPYLQQLDMESNGKRTNLSGKIADWPTAPVVWGEPGTDAQHAFFQFLHQGTDVVPVEFLLAANSHESDLLRHHELLIANCLAQSEALMVGRTLGEATALLLKSGLTPGEAKRLAPHKTFPGNRPSITIAYRMLDPHTLGMLIALFEHRTFVEGCLWDINSFDQWGVELGKEMATALLPAVQGKPPPPTASPATIGLLSQLSKLRDS
jgi:glucose-6-phosphate isomerase